MRRPLLCGALTLSLLAPAISIAQSEEGVFSADGVQIHTDARVHALFALLNDRGYDRETERGPEPTVAARYHTLRQRLRTKLKLGEDLQKQADTFLAAHPESASRYLRAALELEDGPKFAAPEGNNLGGYADLGKLLAGTWAGGAGDIYDDDVADYRGTHKQILPAVDKLAGQARALLRQGTSVEEQLLAENDAAGRVIVIFNPLDSHGTQLRHTVDDTHYVVVGPWKKADEPGVIDPVLVEMVRSYIAGDLQKVGGTPQAASLMERGGPAAAAYKTPEAYLSEALSRVIARTLLKRPLVLRTGFDVEKELPAEADLAKALEAYQKGEATFADALPTILATASGTTTVDAAAPAPAPADAKQPAATPAPAPQAKPAPAPQAKPAGKSG